MNKDNTPTFNVNRKIANFKDFDPKEEKEELMKIRRSTNPNTPDQQQNIGNSRYKFNKVTRKMDELSPEQVKDRIESTDESFKPSALTRAGQYKSNKANFITLEIPESIVNYMSEIGILEPKYSDCFKSYVEYLVGIDSGSESKDFEYWADKSDNIVDFIDG